MKKSVKYSPEVMERAVRMVFDAKDQYLRLERGRMDAPRTTN